MLGDGGGPLCPFKVAKNRYFLPSDIIPQNSLKSLKIALLTSQNPQTPQPIAVNAFIWIHSSPLCPTRGRGRGTYTPAYQFLSQPCIFCYF